MVANVDIGIQKRQSCRHDDYVMIATKLREIHASATQCMILNAKPIKTPFRACRSEWWIQVTKFVDTLPASEKIGCVDTDFDNILLSIKKWNDLSDLHKNRAMSYFEIEKLPPIPVVK